MAVKDPRGGTSFFDLSGELRNAVYEHVIESEHYLRDLIGLACTHPQIHAEFMSLYLRSYSADIPRDSVDSLLQWLFLDPPKSALQDIHCGFSVEDTDLDCSIDVLKVVSTMHRYPLLSIAWDKELDVAISSVLECIDASKVEQLSSVIVKRWLKSYRTPGARVLYIDFNCFRLVVVFKNHVTEEEAYAFGFRDLDPSTKVDFLWEDQHHSEADGSADKRLHLNKVERTRDIEDDEADRDIGDSETDS